MKKGITITVLSVTVAIMLIIVTTVSVVGTRSIDTANFEEYKSKLKRVSDIVLEYVKTNKELPITGEVVSKNGFGDDFINELTVNGDEDSKLYVVDLDKLDIVINIGDGDTSDENIFVVSEETNNVYYLKGRTYRGTTYYGY
ncbi:MAG: hypothetical protein IKV94_03240 [Clostridia bacterium]|nr:hypothetical protein [Clostridia bacterium]